ncbi:penicillin-binding transpeptidase domain-containing protein [Streptomyces sp. NPDC059740]|uniref:penicillin-binding transpeptidase domain-containing protein n=1 Tax=Streptomyces sp. NPDC059740 TaxID=3346926 RepID=UPI00365C0C93
MRRVGRVVLGTAATAVVAALGVGGYNIYSALDDDGTDSGPVAATHHAGPATKAEIRTTAHDFLAAWQAGRWETASRLTDNRPGSLSELRALAKTAHLTRFTLKPGAVTGDHVAFHVTATVSAAGHHGTWAYDSSLHVVRGATTGLPLVDWQSAVINPALARGDTLETGEGAPSVRIADRAGRSLDPAELPSLSALLPALRDRYGDKAKGTGDIGVAVHKADGTYGKNLFTLVKGKTGTLRTTLDARVQRAAEDAVGRYRQASVVVVQPSTGDVLAVANHRDDAFDAALQGRVAPGSTMKVITAAMLLDKGLATAGGPLPCPNTVMAGGRSFHNEEDGMRSGTMADAFAESCNTAFLGTAGKVAPGDLAKEAREVFGLGTDADWTAGVVTFDGSVPADDGADGAAELIGQGRVQMNPLTMASVAATVAAGRFHQPVLVPPTLDGREPATASRSLSPGVQAQLKSMLRRTAVSGTAAPAMGSLRTGDFGAKTGSAEVDGHATSDSWFLAYHGDAAASAMVQGGGHGYAAAGSVVARVLGAS